MVPNIPIYRHAGNVHPVLPTHLSDAVPGMTDNTPFIMVRVLLKATPNVCAPVSSSSSSLSIKACQFVIAIIPSPVDVLLISSLSSYLFKNKKVQKQKHIFDT